MKMKLKILSLTIIAICLCLPGSAQEQQDRSGTAHPLQSLLQASTAMTKETPQPAEMNIRQIRAIVFSTLIPGSGQTYLGEQYKGIAFTLGFYGAGLMAVLSHNNFIGREDRITSLQNDYAAAGNFETANNLWNQIQFEKNNRDQDYKKRTVYSIVTLGILAANVVDIIWFSEDSGAKDFSLELLPDGGGTDLAGNAQLFGIRINL